MINKLLGVLKLNTSNYLKYFASVPNNRTLDLDWVIDMISIKFRNMRKKYNNLDAHKTILDQIVLHIDDGILVLDKRNKIEYVNTLFCEIFGIGNISDICGNYICDTSLNWILNFRDLKTFEVPERYTNLSIICSAEFCGDEAKIYKFKNVSENRRLEYMSREFISNITHELKTPLTSIIGFSETLKNVEEERERQMFYDIINKEAVRLNNLISDILIFSEIETQDNINKQRVDIIKLLHEIKQLLSPQMLELNFDIKILDDKIIVLTNEKCLRQIFINIIDNSIKHSFGTELEINCFEMDNYVYVDFSDNGIGIPDEDINNIFDRFYKVPNSRSKGRGTGLGLSIVKSFVDKINGRIEVINNLCGVTFRIVIPKNGE